MQIGVAISGTGSTMQYLHKSTLSGKLAGKVEMSCIACNNPKAKGLEYALRANIPFEVFPKKEFGGNIELRDKAMSDFFFKHGVRYITLAGYDTELTKEFVEPNKGRIINQHPADDLVRFGGHGMCGLRVHEAVLASDVATTGCTIHFIDDDPNVIDGGEIIYQHKGIPIYRETDTPEILRQRVLPYEHAVYEEALLIIYERFQRSFAF